MLVQIEGPYGRFNFRRGGPRQIWVAGGIGITPFLAWVQSLLSDETRRIYLLYIAPNIEEAFGLDVLEESAGAFPGFSFDVVFSESDGRPDASYLIAKAPFSLTDAEFFFCGPSSLRETILHGLKSRGIRPRHVSFELFEFR